MSMRKKIDEYKRRMYSRKYVDTTKKDLEHWEKLRQKKINVKKNWEDIEEDLKRKEVLYRSGLKGNSFLITFLISLTFFLTAAATAWFYLIYEKNETPLNQMEMSILAENYIGSGDEFSYILKLRNNSKHVYENIHATITYPEGTYDAFSMYDLNKKRIPIKNMVNGIVRKVEDKIVLTGVPDEEKIIKFEVKYNVNGYSTLLTKKKELMVKILPAPIFVNTKLPIDVSPNEEFAINIDVISDTYKDIKDLLVVLKYPSGFEMTENDERSIFHNNEKNIFKIDTLKVADKKYIVVKGKLKGIRNEEKIFAFEAGIADEQNENNIKIKYYQNTGSVIVKKAGFDFKLYCDNKIITKDSILTAGKDVDCEYKILNNLDSKITDLKLKIKYQPDVINVGEIFMPYGYSDTNNYFLYWDKNNFEKLKVLNAHKTIGSQFKIKIKDVQELGGEILNPKLKLSYELSGINFDNNKETGEVKKTFDDEIKIATDLKLKSETTYADSPFMNFNGPDPHVGEETTYTIKWKIYNSTSDVENIVVRGRLPMGVEWKGVVYPKNYYVTYNPDTREIKWALKKVKGFIGYKTEPKTLNFQVGYTPVLTDVGMMKELVVDQEITGTDTYTKKYLSEKVGDTTTDLKSDKILKQGGQVKDKKENKTEDNQENNQEQSNENNLNLNQQNNDLNSNLNIQNEERVLIENNN